MPFASIDVEEYLGFFAIIIKTMLNREKLKELNR